MSVSLRTPLAGGDTPLMGRLKLTVVESRNLAARDGKNAVDPYAIVILDSQEVKKKTLNPMWGEQFTFDITDGSPILSVVVWDFRGLRRDNFLGMVNISAKQFFDEEPYDGWFDLVARRTGGKKESVSGKIRLKLHFTANQDRISVDDFDLLTVVGKGGFGKVMQVRKKDTGRVYAMKVIRKDLVVAKDKVTHTRAEKNILAQSSSHPFIVGLRYSFQSEDKLYLVLDYVNGGELFYHLRKEKMFPEERVRFYAAELVLALEHLHSCGIVYRDLKPENILLDYVGHLRLTDFGLSKEGLGYNDKTKTFCGTPEYLAPEVLKGKAYGQAVDFWSLGTLIYEMLHGLPPFYSTNPKEMYEKILHDELRFPAHISDDAVDFIARLLERDPERRLGTGPNGAAEVKAHPWLRPIDFDELYRKEIEPPFRPRVKGENDVSNFDEEFTSERPADSVVVDSNLSRSQRDAFDGFTFTEGSQLTNKA